MFIQGVGTQGRRVITSARNTVVGVGNVINYSLYNGVGRRVDVVRKGIQIACTVATRENLIGVGKVTMIVTGEICHLALKRILTPPKKD